MTKIWAEAFWKEAPEGCPVEQNVKTRLPFSLVAPCVLLAVITVTIGLWSGPLFAVAEAASTQLLNPDAYINEVLKITDHENTLVTHP